MELEEAIVVLLGGDADLTALIGTRLYPDEAPEDAALPLVIYGQADRKSVMTHAGPQKTNSWGLTLEVYGSGKAQVRNVANAIRQRLNGFKGTVGSLAIQGIFDRSEAAGHSPPIHGDERGVWSVDLSFVVWYAAALPSPNLSEGG